MHRSALIRSAVILISILSVSIFGMGVWLESLQPVSIINPIVSIQWSRGSGVSNVPPRIIFDGEEVSLDTNEVAQGIDAQFRWIEHKLLTEDIKGQNISTESMTLDYIDFFAGVELGIYRYGAYRLLRDNDMFQLSDEDYETEIMYLFPDIPINIQGFKGERLLMTNQEVVDWKTEVLEQQAFMERLYQYLTKRRFQEQSRIVVQTTDPTLRLRFQTDWNGWVVVSGVFTIESCPSISLKQSIYQGKEGVGDIVIPLWKINNIECRRQYIEQGLRTLTHLELKISKDDGYMYPSTSIWRMHPVNCHSSIQEMESSCFQAL